MQTTKYPPAAYLSLLRRQASLSQSTFFGEDALFAKRISFFNGVVTFCDQPIECRAKTFWERELHVVIPEDVSNDIVRYGVYEPRLSEFVALYLKAGAQFIDVGAHFGYFSVLAADIVGNEGRVLAIEPSENSYRLLEKNSADIPQLIRVQIAAWHETTK